MRIGCREGGIAELKCHPFFKSIDWDALLYKEVEAPYVPSTAGKECVQNIDEEFLQEEPKETPAYTSPLLEAYKKNELFTNFDYMNEGYDSHNHTEVLPNGSIVQGPRGRP